MWVENCVPIMEETLHYLGGLFDAEGSIYVTVEKANTTLGYRIRPRLAMNMKRGVCGDEAMEIVEGVCDDWGVTYRTVDTVSSGNEVWSWRVASRESVVEFLGNLRPYLRLKDQQADLILDNDWLGVSEEERFMDLLGVREELRGMSADRDTKYTPGYFKNEFGN